MKPLSPFLLAAGLLCGAAQLEAQPPGATSLPDMVRIALAIPVAGLALEAAVQDPAAAIIILDDGPMVGEVAAESAPKPKQRGPVISDEQRAAIEARVAAELEKRVDAKISSGDPLAAPGMWAYYRDGATLLDAGGTFAMETWDCRLLRGRRCFAGAVAGKKTAGLAVGFGLRSITAVSAIPEGQRRFQLVLWLGFVLPYESAGAGAPAIGGSIKF